MSLGCAFLFHSKLHGMHLNSFPIIWFYPILLEKWNSTRTTVQLGVDKESLKNISKINSMKIIRNFKISKCQFNFIVKTIIKRYDCQYGF